MKITLSSTTPCAATKPHRFPPKPYACAAPAITPSSRPFCTSTYSVSRPSSTPPAKARIATRMLLVMISEAEAARPSSLMLRHHSWRLRMSSITPSAPGSSAAPAAGSR